MMSYCAIFGAAPQHLYEKVGWQWEADWGCRQRRREDAGAGI